MQSSRLTVGLTFDLVDDYVLSPGDPLDKYFEFDTPRIINDIKSALLKKGHKVFPIGNFGKLINQLPRIKEQVDIVFNTAEGLSGRNREAQVPLILEYAGIPFVGSDACTMSVTLDKVMTKKLLVAERVPTPRYFVSDRVVDEETAGRLGFPMVVKPRGEGSSMGITKEAVVSTLWDLNRQIVAVSSLYKQEALVEEFISGREFTVGFVGNDSELTRLPLLEVLINNESVGNRAYLAQYVYSQDTRYVQPRLPVELEKNIALAARKTYEAVECRDFGRVDLRVDGSGRVYVLEINSLPALSQEDAFGQAAQILGISFDDIIGRILDAARQRWGGLRLAKVSDT